MFKPQKKTKIMKIIQTFESFINENRADGLFLNHSEKNKNTFLFPGETDTLIAPVQRVKLAPLNQAIGNNYNFSEFAKSCKSIGIQINLGRDRYDVYPEFTMIIPNIVEMTFSYDKPIFKSKTNLSYSEKHIYKYWNTGIRRDGYYWMMDVGGSVKVNTKTIRDRFELYAGMFIREAHVSKINWGKLNIQYYGQTFNPSLNQRDLDLWLTTYWMEPEWLPAYEMLNIPNAITFKIKTVKYN